MSKTPTALHLPADVYSPDQLSAVIMELRAVIGDQRDAAIRAKSKHLPPQLPQISALLAGVMHNAKVSTTNIHACEELLDTLQKLRAKAPIAHITLADLPNRVIKRQLTEWFRTEIDQSVLLTFAVRSDIGGGIVVQAGSHVYDFSFRQHVMKHRHKIGEIFERVRK